MASIIQDLGIVEEVLADVAAFAAGQPINASVDGYSVSVQVLPNGPVAPFTVISGGISRLSWQCSGSRASSQPGSPSTSPSRKIKRGTG